MSDPVKPEETQQPVVAPKTDEVAPVTEKTNEPAVATTATTTVDEVTPVVQEPAGEAVVEEKAEPQEITKGTLSKFHSGQGALSGLRGGLLSFFKRERFFYFSEEAVSEERLKAYLHKDNASVANAAYATQTGKGLLFYSKQEGHAPHGIIKLADVTDVHSISPTKFDLKFPTGDLHFESPTNCESWVFTLRHKVAEARAAEEEVTSSDGYKAAFEKLTAKPIAVVAGRAPAEVKEKDKDIEEAEKGKKPEGSTAENEAGPSSAMKRSASKGKKKASPFKDLLSKKEKKEETGEKKDGVLEDSNAGEPTPAAATTTTNAPPATDAAEEAKEVKPSQEAGTPAEPAAGPSKKRQSIFNPFSFKKEKEAEEKKEKEPEAVVKTEQETEAKPIDTPVAPGSTEKSERTSTSSPPKPKFSFFGGRKVEKEHEAKPEEVKPTETATEPVPVPGAAADAATPAEGASAADSPSPATSPKERRLSSFFPFKKEKKTDDVKSDSEEAEPSSPKPSTSPANFVVGLYRRASKAGRSSPKETEAKEVVAPATVPEEAPAVTTTASGTEIPNGTDGTAEPTAPVEHATTIGDVVAEAVNVGQTPPVQAAAA